MVGAAASNFMYRVWAPWDSVGVRSELVGLLDGGLVTPKTHPRVIDLVCHRGQLRPSRRVGFRRGRGRLLGGGAGQGPGPGRQGRSAVPLGPRGPTRPRHPKGRGTDRPAGRLRNARRPGRRGPPTDGGHHRPVVRSRLAAARVVLLCPTRRSPRLQHDRAVSAHRRHRTRRGGGDVRPAGRSRRCAPTPSTRWPAFCSERADPFVSRSINATRRGRTCDPDTRRESSYRRRGRKNSRMSAAIRSGVSFTEK